MISARSGVARRQREVTHRIKPEWLGVEAQVLRPEQRREGNRLVIWGRRRSLGRVLCAFLSGVAAGGCLALFLSRVESGTS